MLNHLPTAAKDKVKHEYWIRLAVVLCLLFGSAFIGITILHTPSYVVIDNQITEYQDSFAAAAARKENLQAAEETVRETNQLVDRILENASTTPLRQFYQAINVYTSRGVEVTGFSVSRNEDTGEPGVVSINGVAATREALAAFQDQLEADEHFAKAELPISSLASSRDIEFAMTLTPMTE